MTTVTDREHPHRPGSRRRVVLLSSLMSLLMTAGLLLATAAPAAAPTVRALDIALPRNRTPASNLNIIRQPGVDE